MAAMLSGEPRQVNERVQLVRDRGVDFGILASAIGEVRRVLRRRC